MANSCRELRPSSCLLRALERCRSSTVRGVHGKRNDTPVIDLPQVERLEALIGTRLHDDVIALVALGDPLAKHLTGIEDTLTIETAADDITAPDGYVCIATVSADPIQELNNAHHSGPYYELFVPHSAAGDEPTLRIRLDGSFDGNMTTGAFIDRLLNKASEDGIGGVAPECKTTAALEPAAKIVPGTPLVREPLGRAVHKKFGEGDILRRIEDGEHEKFVIAFADGERTLLARFVQVMK